MLFLSIAHSQTRTYTSLDALYLDWGLGVGSLVQLDGGLNVMLDQHHYARLSYAHAFEPKGEFPIIAASPENQMHTFGLSYGRFWQKRHTRFVLSGGLAYSRIERQRKAELSGYGSVTYSLDYRAEPVHLASVLLQVRVQKFLSSWQGMALKLDLQLNTEQPVVSTGVSWLIGYNKSEKRK